MDFEKILYLLRRNRIGKNALKTDGILRISSMKIEIQGIEG
ncbi:MAG: hypothetical protein Q8911_08065 [Bacillota bacterium]|nr:hypothetical protein [Bacillota bacterium]